MIVLARKKYLIFAALICVLLVALAVHFIANENVNDLRLNGRSFSVETEADDASRAQGLSGRDQIASNHAMIFVFDHLGQQCFWMKDMKFNIDMVWLDTANKVSAIERNVSPASYPQNFCHPGLRVIEFSSGTGDRIHLKIGDQAYLRAQH